MRYVYLIGLLSFFSINSRVGVPAEEENHAGEIVGFLLRDVFGGMITLKASEGNPEIAAHSLKQILHGMASIVEKAVKENARFSGRSLQDIELIIGYLQSTVLQSLETEEGKRSLSLFLEEFKNQSL